jgi:hypothetical protein
MRKLPVITALVLVLACPTFGVAQDREPRLFLVFVDDLHLDFRSTPCLRELMKRMMPLLSQEGDQIALVTTGASSVNVAPTEDFQQITSGMSRITGNGLRADQILDPEHAPERIHRAIIAIDTARQAIRIVASRAKRPSTVLYFSGGYAELPVPAKLAELVSEAHRLSSAIYTFEARSLAGGPKPTPSVWNQAAWDAYHHDARESLRGLAESTGGRMVSTTGEFDSTLAQIARTAND